MEKIRIEINSKDLLFLTQNGIEYTIRDCFTDYDYTHNKEWKAYKDRADKAFKELRKLEFKIRHNL